MHLTIVSMSEKVFDGEVQEILVPTKDGTIGVLGHHEPLITAIIPGEITWIQDKKEHHLFTSGGFLHVENNEVKLLTDTTEDLASMTEKDAEEAKIRAEKGIAEAIGSDAVLFAKGEMQKSLARLKVIRRKHRRHRDTYTSES